MLLLWVVFCTVIFPFYWIYKPPAFLIRYFQKRWPDVLWQVDTPTKVVALTIDDAPSEHTDEIVDILNENHASATFFVIGSQASGREEILRSIVHNGNELGNHAMHDAPSRSLSDAALFKDIKSVETIIDDTYAAVTPNLPPKYFRPGSGFFHERMLKLLDKLGYRLVLGGIYPHDAQIPYWRINAKHILSRLRPGAIIICHDRRSWTVPMLQKVLPEIRRRGYRVTTITGLLKAAEPQDS
ncbi:MAG: hypothetical protein Q9191_001628 [Dirinaria sp. TL-2023a]